MKDNAQDSEDIKLEHLGCVNMMPAKHFIGESQAASPHYAKLIILNPLKSSVKTLFRMAGQWSGLGMVALLLWHVDLACETPPNSLSSSVFWAPLALA